MLTEIKHVHQIANEGYRRWFTDESFDLIVWFMNEKIQGFQLCYDSGKEKRAITWRLSLGYSHEGIDDGERMLRNKMTPVLVADGTFEKDIIAEKFRSATNYIDNEIASFVYNVLRGYPG